MMKILSIFMALGMMFLLSACGVNITHVSHESLNALKEAPKVKGCVLVADIGDTRAEGPDDRDKLAAGASYWFPVVYTLRDVKGDELYTSRFVADSILADLKYIGYEGSILNKGNNISLSEKDALVAAKSSDCNYLITSNLKAGKTNFWGFLIIPFFEPVWTTFQADIKLYNLKNDTPAKEIKMANDSTEWYFGKIAVGDAIFDAGLFGGHWMRTAWGETVIPEGIAKGVILINEEMKLAHK